ncbi:MAG: hypothetical protein OEZ06_01375 [Myxococcales bacterium]|nr:hypothetical protein [Myxococcales bacterium]
MYRRVVSGLSVLVFGLLPLVAACGDDSGGSGNGGSGAGGACTAPGTESLPTLGPTDPCAGVAAGCNGAGQDAVAICGANGMWGACMCKLRNNCGNGIVDPGEDCDGANTAGQSCPGLGFGGGTLTCGPTCMFNTTMCITGTGTGVAGAGG